MKKEKNKIKLEHIPYLISSCICGVLVGAVIFIFKVIASAVISLSESAYLFVRDNPIYLPLLIISASLLGVFSAFILRAAPEGKGGGIPTAISVVRGLVKFNWVKSLFSMFTSAMLTYLCAVPLGNEGPSVQMGTALGRGCVRMFGEKNVAMDKYVMTGGACAGFAAATGAPLTGILFAFEETHKRFSPLIFSVSAICAVSATTMMKVLCDITSVPFSLFHFADVQILPIAYMPIALLVGIACGGFAVLLSKGYGSVRNILSTRLSRIPFIAKIIIAFSIVSLFGFVSADFIGSGHHLVEHLVLGQGVWYLMLICLVVRAVLLLFANNIGVTGGLFVPTLAFGALCGAIVGKALVSIDLLPEDYYSVAVIIGIASVLAAFSHTPLMAIAFSLEALGAVENILHVIIGVAVAYVFVERFAAAPFTDVVIEAKVEDAHRGKESSLVDAELIVKRGSFIVGKEIRDILWPPMCMVTSVIKNPDIKHREGGFIYEGDKLLVHFISYDVDRTMHELESYIGSQNDILSSKVADVNTNDSIPEI